MPIDARRQVEFISYLQRLLVEGDFVATYKFALLHAIADICIERPLILNADPALKTAISIDDLVEKFIELYWQHSLPFGANDGYFVLIQNSGKQSALINSLIELRHQGVNSLSQLKAHLSYPALLRKTRGTLKDGPLWRLQNLSRNEECFLYPHDKTKNYIELNPGIAFCFRRFHDLVVSLARTQWVQKIAEFPANQVIIGSKGNLSEFLFGSDRQTITYARPVLLDIQKGQCFYCQKSLKETGEVDHFIPWARYPNDLGHNFVLAHSSCNNQKRDHLAAQHHKDNWYEQNIIRHGQTLHSELSRYFVCESDRSEAITTWAYQLAGQNRSPLWFDKKTFVPFNALDNDLSNTAI